MGSGSKNARRQQGILERMGFHIGSVSIAGCWRMRNAIQDNSPKPALRKRAARGNQYEAVEMAEVNDPISTGRIMRTRKIECAMSFHLWTVQGTWFWSLVYPDRHGGAIGAAASEAEALGEAQAAIKRLPQLLD